MEKLIETYLEARLKGLGSPVGMGIAPPKHMLDQMGIELRHIIEEERKPVSDTDGKGK